MKNSCLSLIIIYLITGFCLTGTCVASASLPPDEEWNETFGGSSFDKGYSIQQTDDGGYILAGETWSYSGSSNFLLVKTDSNGTKEWLNVYGYFGNCYGRSVVQTVNGYVVTGKMSVFSSDYDVWLVKADSLGKEKWNRTFGGAGNDEAFSVVQTEDGGFIITGHISNSSSGSYDIWLIKTDSGGNKEWNKTFGGAGNDEAFSVVQTEDGGFAVAGYIYNETSGRDLWLIKTDSEGNEQWNRTFGGIDYDEGHSVVQTEDGGFAVAGYTTQESMDVWLIKTDSSGNEEWNRTFGGQRYDEAYSVIQIDDGGFVMAGGTESHGNGGIDAWLIKTDSEGNEEWNKTFGGAGNDEAFSVVQTEDGGFAVAGYTGSYGEGLWDAWLIKLTPENRTEVPEIAYLKIEDREALPNFPVEVNITASNVTDLANFDISVEFNSSLLNLTNVTNNPAFGEPLINLENVSEGWVRIASLNLGTGFSGNVLLTTLTFEGKREGESFLNLTAHTFVNSSEVEIPVSVENGTFTIMEAPEPSPPAIEIISPENTTYIINEIPLNVTADREIDTWLYNLNETGNVTFTPNTTILVYEGLNHLIIYATDTEGITGSAEVFFTVDVTPPYLYNLKIAPELPVVGEGVNITVEVEESNVKNVIANLTKPGGATVSEEMIHLYNQTYSVYFNMPSYGIYYVNITAIDMVNHSNTTSDYFAAVLFSTNSSSIGSNTSLEVINNSHAVVEITADENFSGSAVINTTISPLPGTFGLMAINATEMGTEGLKYLNITSELDNISKIRIEIHYTDEEVEGLGEGSVAVFYWNGSDWINCTKFVNRTIPDGSFVFEAGNNPEENYAYAVVNHTSIYGLGGLKDTDGDGVPDIGDNCPGDYNPEQNDTDGDGAGDVCDLTCGDVNCNGKVNIGDVILILNNITYGYPVCNIVSADVNCSGTVGVNDAIKLINHITHMHPMNCCYSY